jgi:hypothetical protein
VAVDGVTAAVRAGLVAFAAGDAAGRPWAGRGPREISKRTLLDDVGPTGWATEALLAAAGAASLGTAAGAGAASLGAPGAAGAEAPPPPGHFPAALALGWREPDPAARRAAALPLGFAAVLVADLAAWALEGRALRGLGEDHSWKWYAPIRGIPADDRGVMDGLLWLTHRWQDPDEGIRSAVRLGGRDPGLLAGLLGALLVSRTPALLSRLRWLDRVVLPAPERLDAAASALTAR